MVQRAAQQEVFAVPARQPGPVVIIGTGPTGIRVAEEILRRKPDQRIVMYGEEPWAPYNRVQLSSFLSGDISQDALLNFPRVDSPNALMMHHHSRVVAINPNLRQVTDEHGMTQAYSSLVLATGSRAHMPKIPGLDKMGVYTFRNMNDAQRLMARRVRSRNTVVLGGGLLGLEAARAMQKMNTRVTLIEHAPSLMARQLDEASGEMLREHVLQLGIQVILANGVVEVLGDESVHAVKLRNGREIECDTMIVATGIQPVVELAREARLSVGRGILVNDSMQTNDPFIYAIGECAEHRGEVHGLVAPGLEQATVAADQITGGQAQYHGTSAATRLKVLDKTVFSMGEVNDASSLVSCNVYVYNRPERGVYRKIVLRKGRLIGVIAIGDWDELNRIQEIITYKHRLWPWQSLRFMQSGRLWLEDDAASVVDWPAAAVVCNCRGVCRGELSEFISQGCASVECLGEKSGAGSVCGSCKPLLGSLLGSVIEHQKIPFGRLLAYTTSLALGLVLLWWFSKPIPVGDSVDNLAYRIGILWRDDLYKQISGFTLLGLSLLGLVVSLRKRLRFFSFGSFGFWRAFHSLLGVMTLTILVLHTGLRTGEQLNAWLQVNFLLVAAIGALSAWTVLMEQRRPGFMSKQLRRWTQKLHLLFSWPLPLLVGFHIVSVYYF